MRWLDVPAALHMNARIFMKPLLVERKASAGRAAAAEAGGCRGEAGRCCGSRGRRQRASQASLLFYSLSGRRAELERGGHVPGHPVVTQLPMIYWPPMGLQDGRASL